MADTSELIAIAQSVQLDNYLSSVAVVLIAYEIAITFDREVELIWQKKIGNASVLFLVNRYLSLVVNSMYSPYPGSPGTQPVGLGYSTIGLDTFGCELITRLSDSTNLHRASCLIASDLLVIGITWTATFKLNRALTDVVHTPSISGILLRDGAIYFIVLVILNVLHLSLSLASISVELNSASSVVVLIEPITTVIISRFLLDLQEANNLRRDESTSASSLETLMFDGVTSSLGSTLPVTDSRGMGTSTKISMEDVVDTPFRSV
ncbi:hypothetical protein C8Q76DRAFT_800534 [Earliella scabrosa]|nr:hypothetical protein C8Q76DRAFT_800534 [Earliella scabrosa]